MTRNETLPSARWFSELDAEIADLRRQELELRAERRRGFTTCAVCRRKIVLAADGVNICPDCRATHKGDKQ